MRKFLEFFNCSDSLITKLTKPSFEEIKVAIWKQEMDKMSQLLANEAPTREKGQSILHFAIIENKAQAVQYIASRYPNLINEKNEDGDTPLMLALFSSSMKIIKCLLPYSNHNLRDDIGNTTFIIAAANGNIPALEAMLESCNNTMVRNFEGQTALHRASYYGELQTIKFLLQRTNLKLYQVDQNNNNSLHLACMSCNIICIRYMINKVKDPSRLLQAENKESKKPICILEETVRKMNDFKKSEKSSISIDQIKNYIFGREESFSN